MAELIALFTAWRADIDSEPFAHIDATDAAVAEWRRTDA